MLKKPLIWLKTYKSRIIILTLIMIILIAVEIAFLKNLLTPLCAGITGSIIGVAVFCTNLIILRKLSGENKTSKRIFNCAFYFLLVFIGLGGIFIAAGFYSLTFLLCLGINTVVQLFAMSFCEVYKLTKAERKV